MYRTGRCTRTVTLNGSCKCHIWCQGQREAVMWKRGPHWGVGKGFLGGGISIAILQAARREGRRELRVMPSHFQVSLVESSHLASSAVSFLGGHRLGPGRGSTVLSNPFHQDTGPQELPTPHSAETHLSACSKDSGTEQDHGHHRSDQRLSEAEVSLMINIQGNTNKLLGRGIWVRSHLQSS